MHVLISIDLIVKMKQNLVLAFLNKEVSYRSWHSISDVSNDENEVLINSKSKLTNEGWF